MAKKKDELKQTTDYVAFLEKRLASKNFRANVSLEEFEATKEKLKKARFRLRLLNK